MKVKNPQLEKIITHCKKLDEEGSTTILNECCGILKNKSDKGNTWKKQDLEHLEEKECKNDGETRNVNKDSLSKKMSEEMEHKRSNETNDSCKDDPSKKISEEMEHNDDSETNDRCEVFWAICFGRNGAQ